MVRRRLGDVLALMLALVLSLGVSPAALAQSVPPARVSLQAIEVALELLLAQYARPLDATVLLDAGWRGALQAAGSPEVVEGAAPPFPAEKAAAWADFQERFGLLVAAGADPATLARAATRAMAKSVADCHTHSAQSHQKEIESVTGPEQYGGIGASVLDASAFDPPASGPVVQHLIEGGPAMKAGLRLGDAILAVDGVDAASLTSNQLVELVRGAPGSSVQLRVDRPGAPAALTIQLERSMVEETLLEWRALPSASPRVSAIGYVQLRGFNQAVERAVPEALERLQAQGVGGWILDLRNNGGGDVRTFASIASLFIKEGTLAVMADRSGAETGISANGWAYRPYTQPLAVLVDRYTASAAELLAADVQEYGAGRVFGGTTAGCFGTSQLFRLPDDTAVWITVRSLKTGRAHRDVHKIGVTPDEVVTRSWAELAEGRDPQLARAMEWLVSRQR